MFPTLRTPLALLSTLALVSAAGACASDGEKTDTAPACAATPDQSSAPAHPFSGLTYEKPFGPDAPVEMATVWGDRAAGAHATIGVFGAGFDSGPHTHTEAYHGVVVQGLVSNPFGTETDPVEMSPGSYWFVPAGEQHATICLSTDTDCIIYFHAGGAFDFAPVDAFSNPPGATATAVAAESLVFEELAPFVSMSTVWGDRASSAHGTFGKMPGNASSPEHVHTGAYLGVVISGTAINPFRGEAASEELPPGSTWEVPAGAQHRTACVSAEPCVFYFHALQGFDFTPTCEQ